jgi:hypothetical protein
MIMGQSCSRFCCVKPELKVKTFGVGLPAQAPLAAQRQKLMATTGVMVADVLRPATIT